MHIAAQPLAVPTLTADRFLIGGEVIIHGWAFIETTGAAPATIELFDGDPDVGLTLGPIALSQGESTRDWLAGAGIGVGSDLWARVSAGSVRGSVWIVPAQRYNDVAIGQGEILAPGGYE